MEKITEVGSAPGASSYILDDDTMYLD